MADNRAGEGGRLMHWIMAAVYVAVALAWGVANGAEPDPREEARAAELSRMAMAREAGERVSAGVVSLETESGTVSGYLVDASGLILTSARAVRDSPWIVARIDHGGGGSGVGSHTESRRAARIIAADEASGLFIVRVNPEGLGALSVIPRLARERLFEGLRVFTPASGLVTGAVYRVGPGVVLMDHDLTGNPLGIPVLSLSGELVGLLCERPAGVPQGRDVWGFRPAADVEPLLATARTLAAESLAPPATPLPALSPVPIPADALGKAALPEHKPYDVPAPKNLDAFILTPFVFASAARRPSDSPALGGNVLDGSGIFPVVSRLDLGYADPVVTIEVLPVSKETSRSKWVRALVPDMSPGRYYPDRTIPAKPGWEAPEPMKEREFRDSFSDMQLVRDGAVVQPVRRVRFRVGDWGAPDVATPASGAFGGAHAYDPSAFEPDKPLTLRIRKASDPDRWYDYPLDASLQRRVWDEFAPWRAVRESAG